MATFKQYTKKDGSKAWSFQTYLGTDPATGKEVRTTRRNFATKKEAQSALNKVLLDFEKHGANNKQAITFQEVYDLWVVSYENTVKESTFVKQTEQLKNHALAYFSKMKIDKITIATAQKFANEKVKKFSKYREFISNASRIFDFAINTLGYKQLDNPFKKIIVPKRKTVVDDEPKVNYYTRDELETFIHILENNKDMRLLAFFRTLAFSGMRVGELLGLSWADINFKDNYIRITKTLARGKDRRLYLEQPKTAHSKRVIPMDGKTMDTLKQWRHSQRKWLLGYGHNTLKPKQLVFSNQDNEFLQLSKPRTWFKKIIRENDLKRITIHGLRHTHASLMLESGSTIKDIQERLGHASVEITSNLYIHITETRKDETAIKFANYVGI